jgi:negative regulator of flagellin synthesis FlgM
MADKINGYGRSGDATPARARAVARAERQAAERAADGRKPAVDDARFTETATSLQQAEARLRAQPDVDAARVESVRRRVQSGEYRVDADRLAARLVRFERGLT